MNTLALRQLDGPFWLAAVAGAKLVSAAVPFRRSDPRPLILRPGGMGDLILLTIAAEELGLDPRRDFLWVIERRSRVWAKHLRLDHVCYDDGLFARHLELAGRFSTIINSEQRFGLSQATALLACGRHSTLTCFETNRAAFWAGRQVSYDPDSSHETVEFQKLLAAALGVSSENRRPVRLRMLPAGEMPVVGVGGLQAESRAFTEDEWERFIRSWIGGGRFWIASSENDRPFARRLEARFGSKAAVFDGNFSALCELISRSEEVLTIDGGFLHIASYYGVPVTGLFTSGRERKWAALAPGSRVIRRSDLPCQPCTWFGQVPKCRHEFACKELDFDQQLSTAAVRDNATAQSGLLPVMRD